MIDTINPSPLSRLFGRVRRKYRAIRERWDDLRAVRRATVAITGPQRVRLARTDVALVCLMKDAAYFLPELLRHHRNLGVRHFLFIDNGSQDASLEILSGQPDVTVLQNLLPVKRFECLMRSELARQVFDGGWFLFVDTDELAEFPVRDAHGISDIVRYCNDHGYSAVVSQMLDLVPTASLRETADWSYAKSVEQFDRFSLHDVKSQDYHSPETGVSFFLQSNTVSNDRIFFNFGGLRHEVFGEDCALTKHSLVKNSRRSSIYTHPHCSSHVRCADFSMLIRHYKFAGDFLERETRQVRNRTWNHNEDARRLAHIETPDFRIESRFAERLSTVDQLLEAGFLVTSDQFRLAFSSSGATSLARAGKTG